MFDRFQKASWLALFAAPFLISASSGEGGAAPTVLTVSGQGYSSQASQVLTVNASSSSWSKYAGHAVRDNASVLDRLRDRLARNDIDPRDITSGGFRLSEARDPDDNDGDRDRGYQVSQQLVIFIRDPDAAGPVIDALVEAGADGINVGRSNGYGQVTTPETQKEAREAAVNDARQKAEDYADAFGMKIVRVATVGDGGVRMTGSPAPIARATAVDIDIPTQIDNGESAVLASVSVEFELAPR